MVMKPQSVKDSISGDEPSNTVPMYSSSNVANQSRKKTSSAVDDAIKRRMAKNDTQNADIADQRKMSSY